MQYRINLKNGDRLSQLGLGCMRFPRTGRRIDREKTNELVAAAINSGVNYFDTAYIYPGSEEALGEALTASGKRDQIFIATKLPHYTCKKYEDFDKIFNAQLERLQTTWIDYYLIHMLSNTESWERIKAFGIEQWLESKRKEGSIRNVGFSFHGGRESFLELLDVYDWDLCMVQYNYYDENNQASSVGVRAAFEKKIPVIAMEPLLGGTLAGGLNEEAKRAFSKADEKRTPVDWAIRWLLNQQEITMALSGMSSMAQLRENCTISESCMPGSLSGTELSAYEDAVSALKKAIKIQCTGCGYCMPCPKGVDIPSCFTAYNASYSFDFTTGLSQYVQVTGQTTPVQSDASKCVACGKCEPLCPQSIPIIKELKKVKRRMLTFLVKPVLGLARKVLKIR